MTPTLLTAVITAFGGILIAGATYWFTKMRERHAELRKEKLEHYKEFVASLSGVIAGETTPEKQRIFARACNCLMLVAPQKVIEALREFQQEIRITNPHAGLRHDELLSKLFFEMRNDLGVTPPDDMRTLKVGLWSSGYDSEGNPR